MPADYDAIRAGNIARYGTDTAVLALLGQLYSDRAQFLYELIQNAEDAGATWLDFALSEDRLEVSHNGHPFTESDVQAICAVGSSAKHGDLTAIGRFGIGFKAVYAYTSTPSIHSPAADSGNQTPAPVGRTQDPGASAPSPAPAHPASPTSPADPAGPASPASTTSNPTGHTRPTSLTGLDDTAAQPGHSGPGEHFRIEHYVRPTGIPAAGRAGETLFVFPFDRADVPAATAVDEVSAGLTRLPSRALLFLRSIGRITISGLAGPVTLERTTEILGPDRRRIRLRRSAGPAEPGRAADTQGDGWTGDRLEPGGRQGSEGWLVWHRNVRLPVPARAGQDAGSAGLEPAGAGITGQEPADLPGGQRVEIAVPLRDGPDGPQAAVLAAAPVVAFFATQKESFLGFLVQGPYRTTPARDNVPEHDPVNQYLAGQTAVLLPQVLAGLRDDGLLTAGMLDALPLDEARFPPGSLLRGLYDAAREALARDPLLPAEAGGWARAGELALAADPALQALLAALPPGAEPHGPLTGPAALVSAAVSAEATPRLWRFLLDATSAELITPESFTAGLTAEFLAGQPHEWVAELYGFLYRHPDLWEPGAAGEVAGPARTAPIIRLADGRQVPPVDAAGQPAVFLPAPGAAISPPGHGLPDADLPDAGLLDTGPPDPERPDGGLSDDGLLDDGPLGAGLPGRGPLGPGGPGAGPVAGRPGGENGLPVVHPALAAIPAARRFLEALRLGAPDPVAEVLASVLPRYAADRGLTVDGLDEAQHLADVEQVAEALVSAAPAARQELTEQLAVTGFLAGENAATGEQRLMAPGQLFLRTPGTEAYLAGNPDAWFARDRYGPWRAQLQELGVRDTVPAQSRPPGPDGHVLVAMEFARNERGLHGFDPEASIEGLGFALGHPDHRRSEYVWNELLVPNRNLLAGTVERSARLGFAGADRAEVRSAIGAAAAAATWLPGPDGAFHRPDELQLDDLPPAFKRDDQVAAALGMIASVVAEASRLLGLPPGLLRGLAAHPDLVALVERELAAREGGTGTSHPDRGPRPAVGERDTAGSPDLWALLAEPSGGDPDEPPGWAP